MNDKSNEIVLKRCLSKKIGIEGEKKMKIFAFIIKVRYSKDRESSRILEIFWETKFRNI